MNKDEAISLLGGSVAKAADAIGINSQAISQWPAELPPRLADRVQAALYRMNLRRSKKTPGQLPTQEATHE